MFSKRADGAPNYSHDAVYPIDVHSVARGIITLGELRHRARERIIEMVARAIAYLRSVQGAPDFIPLSFRAGNWLFQPGGVLIEQNLFQ